MSIIKHLGLSMLILVLAVNTVVGGCTNNSGTTQDSGIKALIGRGKLSGKVMRGPTSPVLSNNIPSPVEPASNIRLIISTPEGQQIDFAVTDSQGAYSIILPPGIYRIEMAPLPGIEFSKDLPASITITEGRETHLDIFIDTGIR